MDAWRDIRLKAREYHRQALLKAKGVRKAPELLAAALKEEDLQLAHYAPGSVVSKGVYGFLDRCVYRKLKSGRNDGEARRGLGVNE